MNRAVALLLEDPRQLDSGSRIRDFYLCDALAAELELTIYCFRASGRSDAPERELAAELVVAERRHAGAGLASMLAGRPHHQGVFDFSLFGARLERDLARANLVHASMLYPAHHVSKWRLKQPRSGTGPLVVWDTHNNDLEVWRSLRQEHTKWRYPYLRWNEALARRAMASVAESVDLTLACSERDSRMLGRMFGTEQVRLVSNGVAVDDWVAPSHVPTLGRTHFVTFGSWSRPTNSEPLSDFLREAWPSVRSAMPTATLDVVGRAPVTSVRKLVSKSAGVSGHFDVPDVRPFVWRAGAVIVPHADSTGSKLKIYEALATGRAIVTRAEATRGIPEQLKQHIHLVDEVDDWPSKLRTAGSDSSDPKIVVRELRRRFDWAAISRQYRNLVKEMLVGH